MKTSCFFRILFTAFLVAHCSWFVSRAFDAPSHVSKRRTIHRNTNPSLSGRLSAEGKLRLVGGRVSHEGNVEIYHLGRYGSICDDEWDLSEGHVACRSLGYPFGAERVTDNGQFGRGRKMMWMDNLYCTGNETELFHCPFDGWAKHDCNTNEAAGVVCRVKRPAVDDRAETSRHDGPSRDANANQLMNTVDGDLQAVQPSKLKKLVEGEDDDEEEKEAQEDEEEATEAMIRVLTEDGIKIRLVGGRNELEGRVEVHINKGHGWGVICGDGWSLLEAMVVCRQQSLGYAQHALQNIFIDGHNSSIVVAGIKCNGNEKRLADCALQRLGSSVACPGPKSNVAGVICTAELPDLVPDEKEIEKSVYLEDRQMMLLQCAAEENCLSTSSRAIDRNDYNWFYETRRLLRFTARIGNMGTADFIPFTPKHTWEWHSCHRHYHSMEVFAHFDIFDVNGTRVAEGHKASFCLEDNDCKEGVEAKYKCANYGDQGITVGCTDTYLHSIDCQWIDITDMQPGIYQLKISVNPEMKVAELSFDNNAVVCSLYYSQVNARVWNCTLTRP